MNGMTKLRILLLLVMVVLAVIMVVHPTSSPLERSISWSLLTVSMESSLS